MIDLAAAVGNARSARAIWCRRRSARLDVRDW